MTSSLSLFFPEYPVFDPTSPLHSPGAAWELFRKKEFYDYRLEAIEPRPLPGQLTQHQTIMRRFLSQYTPYRGILLFHEMGTGKTCESVAIIEGIRTSRHCTFKQAVIVVPSDRLKENYLNELIHTCTRNVYVNEQATKSFYRLLTYTEFLKEANPIEAFKNSIIVMDEAHHVLEEQKQQNFNVILKQLIDVKLILMTGTPMVDKATDIILLLNMILPVPLNEAMFFQQDTFRRERALDFQQAISGHISYLRASASNVEKRFRGAMRRWAEEDVTCPFPLYNVTMSPDQRRVFELASRQDPTKLQTEAQQAGLLVGPNNKYGENLPLDLPYIQTLQDLAIYSAAYHACLEMIKPDLPQNHFVYCERVARGGVGDLGLLLKRLTGMTEYDGKTDPAQLLSQQPRSRFAVITGKTRSEHVSNIMAVQSHESNFDGRFLKVLIASEVLAEGFSLKNITHVHILTPKWNFSSLDQVIARAFRFGSHAGLERARQADGILDPIQVQIFLYNILPKTDFFAQSFTDRQYLYASQKDIQIKTVERLLKQASVDCLLTKRRNELSDPQLDGQRECDYQSCEFDCFETTPEQNRLARADDPGIELDVDTYDLYYNTSTRRIRNTIITELQQKGCVMLPDLISRIKADFTDDGTSFVVLRVLTDLMAYDCVIRDPLGFACVVRFEGDAVFLIHDLKNSVSWLDFEDTAQMPVFFRAKVPTYEQAVLVDVYATQVEQLVNNLRQAILVEPSNPSQIQQAFEDLTPETQEVILEGLDMGSFDPNDPEDRQVSEVLTRLFQRYIVRVRDITVSFLLNNHGGPLRCKSAAGAWKVCDPHLESEILQQRAQGQIACPNAPFEDWSGQIEPDKNTFQLKDEKRLRDLLARGETKKTKLPQGKACKSYEKPELLKIVADVCEITIPLREQQVYQKLSESKKESICDFLQQYFLPNTCTQTPDLSPEGLARVTSVLNLLVDPPIPPEILAEPLLASLVVQLLLRPDTAELAQRTYPAEFQSVRAFVAERSPSVRPPP